jgi:elongation factor P
MISAVDLKVGVVFEYNDEPCKVLEYKHTHMARGSADVRLKIRGLVSGNVLPLVVSPSMKFEEANLVKKPMQFLYRDGEELHFMNPITFEQFELPASINETSIFLKDGKTYDLLFWDEKAMDILVPPKVTVEVEECDPGVKGNSAANMYKSAVVTGGASVRVPLFIEKGENIRIDSVNLKYVERAK